MRGLPRHGCAPPAGGERGTTFLVEGADPSLRCDAESGQEREVVALVDAVFVVGSGAVRAEAERRHRHDLVGTGHEGRAAGVAEARAALVVRTVVVAEAS